MKEAPRHLGFLYANRYCYKCYINLKLGLFNHSVQSDPSSNASDYSGISENENHEGLQVVASLAGISNEDIQNNRESILEALKVISEGVRPLPSRTSVIYR